MQAQILSITNDNLSLLDTLGISADAKARISAAVKAGKLVDVPNQSPVINGKPTIGWFERDLVTGEITSVLENGNHSGITQTAVVYAALAAAGIFLISGAVAGVLTGLFELVAFRAEAVFSALKFDPVLGQYHYDPTLKAAVKKKYTDSIKAMQTAALQWIPPVGIEFSEALGWFTGFIEKADPPIGTELIGLNLPPLLKTGSSISAASVPVAATLPAGNVSGSVDADSTVVSGNLTATWASTSTTALQVGSLAASNATVKDANGIIVGVGTIGLNPFSPLPVSVSGTVNYSVTGAGNLSIYGPASSQLGVSGDWTNYQANLSGSVAVQLSSDSLVLNGAVLPAGAYTITTSAASVSGSGSSTSPDFSGSVSIAVTNDTVDLGPGTGSLTLPSNSVDASHGITLTGYSGTIDISAGSSGRDSVSVHGSAANVLAVSASPSSLTADQNHAVSFAVSVRTSLADTFSLAALAPSGWTVQVDDSGNVIATPAAGLQSGIYRIKIVAQSTVDSNLIAQSFVDVAVSATAPGLSFAVEPDSVATVPFGGAQLPTAFRAELQNLGPTTDTFNLSYSNLPSGFTVLNAGSNAQVPPALTGILGIYLLPSAGQLPAPGTQVSFTVTATSVSDPSITQSQVVTFTMPAIDAVVISAQPSAVNTTPGVAVTADITLTNVGNVVENNITFTTTLPSGLVVSGLAQVSLGVGQTTTQTITLTPNPTTPLNTVLTATINATFGPAGSPVTQSISLPVNVVVPGAAAIADSALAASQLGNPDLANRLHDLSIALTNLVQTPTSDVFKSQSLASLDAVVALLGADPYLTNLITPLKTDRTSLANATTASGIQTVVTQLGGDLDALGITLTDEAAHRFDVALLPNSRIIQPQTPTSFGIFLQDTGTATTTYDLSISGLPSGITFSFDQPSVTLDPGQTDQGLGGAPLVNVTLTSTSATDLSPFSFTVLATAESAQRSRVRSQVRSPFGRKSLPSRPSPPIRRLLIPAGRSV